MISILTIDVKNILNGSFYVIISGKSMYYLYELCVKLTKTLKFTFKVLLNNKQFLYVLHLTNIDCTRIK